MISISYCLVVVLGGGIGALSRYLITVWASGRFGTYFPYGTLFVNILGCLAVGFIMTFAAERFAVSGNMRLLIITGFFGGFTTFSAFGYETMLLLRAGNSSAAILNIAANLFIGLAAVWLGIIIAKLF